MIYHVQFPGLGLDLTVNRVALAIGTVMAIVCARIYYVAMAPFAYQSIWEMIDIRKGGIAIYGAVLGAFIFGGLAAKWRKVPLLPLFDLVSMGFLIGQGIGRWGNFVNIEAYGGPTSLPWRMGIHEFVNGTWQYVEVHPTFFYESMWNLIGFFVLSWIAKRHRKFDGQMFASYFLWYGIGRAFIEGLRTDSLYLMQTSIRVSQLFGLVTALIALVAIFYNLKVKKHTPEELWVNQVSAKGPIPRRVALIFPEGNAQARAWADSHKAEGYTEEYAIPPGLPADEAAELASSLKERTDLDKILVWEASEKEPPS